MRWVVIVAVLVAAPTVRADSLFDIVGGLAIPVADNTWTKDIDPSPKLAVHAGGTSSRGTDVSFGAMIGVDWTPAKTGSGNFGVGNFSYSFNRFRALVSGLALIRAGSKLMFDARAGVGIDLTLLQSSGMVLGTSTSSSDTETGFAFELGGGAWFDLGSLDIGAEAALPVGVHPQHTSNGITYQGYTSVDVDLLFGVRFRR